MEKIFPTTHGDLYTPFASFEELFLHADRRNELVWLFSSNFFLPWERLTTWKIQTVINKYVNRRTLKS